MTEEQAEILKTVNDNIPLLVLINMYNELPIQKQIKLDTDINSLVIKYMEFRSIEHYLENRKAKRSTIK